MAVAVVAEVAVELRSGLAHETPHLNAREDPAWSCPQKKTLPSRLTGGDPALQVGFCIRKWTGWKRKPVAAVAMARVAVAAVAVEPVAVEGCSQRRSP